MKPPSDVNKTVEMYQEWLRLLVAPGITKWVGLACATAANIGPIPPK